jgi:hypothetical protein
MEFLLDSPDGVHCDLAQDEAEKNLQHPASVHSQVGKKNIFAFHSL